MILITGASGFIGNNLLRYIKDAGHIALGVSRTDSSFEGIIKSDYSIKNLLILINDYKPNILIHAAGSASVHHSQLNPEEDYINSIDLYRKVLEAIRISGIKMRVIFLSSAAVYGDSSSFGLVEDSKCNPISVYGFNKKICEILGNAYRKIYGIEVCSIRLFSVFGEGQKRLLIWDIYQKSIREDSIMLFGSGTETRDYIYIDDLSWQILKLIEYKGYIPELINLGSGKFLSVSDLAEKIRNILNCEKKIQFNNKTRDFDPVHLRANTSKFNNIINTQSHFNLNERLHKTISEWKK